MSLERLETNIMNFFSNKHKYYFIASVRDAKQEVDDKWRFFTKIYHSQAFMPSLRYKFQLRLVPNKIGYAAQMFVKANDDMLHEDLAKLDKQEMLTTLERLSGKINNIKEIRKAVTLFK